MKMFTEMPTKVEVFSVSNAPDEDSHESAHGKFSSAHGKISSAHEDVHESVLGQFSHVMLSHGLFLGHVLKLDVDQ